MRPLHIDAEHLVMQSQAALAMHAQAMLTASALLSAGTYILIALLFGFLRGELHQGEGNAASTTAAVLEGAGEALMSLRWTAGDACSSTPISHLQATHLRDVIKHPALIMPTWLGSLVAQYCPMTPLEQHRQH